MVSIDLESHASVFGRTSSGKTYFFRDRIWRRSTKRIVFVNTQRETGFGPEVSKWRVDLLAKPGARVNLCGPRPSTSEAERDRASELLARVVDDLIRVGERAARDRRTLVVLACDEAHLFAANTSQPRDPLSLLGTNGKRYGITLVAVTQRPALLSQTVKSQSTNHILFDLDDYEAPYLKEYGVPDHVRAWISDAGPGLPPGTPNRRFAVRTGKQWALCKPV